MGTRNLVLVGALLALAAPARAGLIVDPKKPFTWNELLACEQVVVAKYKSHNGPQRLTLEVVRVLKGPALKPGDTITVALEHWYSVETGPVGYDALRGRNPGDGVPKLCYKTQIINPGPAVPSRIVGDVRKPAIYFLPKANAPSLERSGQVALANLADGWDAVLNARPAGLLFRLLQTQNAELNAQAVETLAATRDPKTLDALFAIGMKSPTVAPLHWHALPVQEILSVIGDRNGDVYDRAWKAFRQDTRPPEKITFSPGAIAVEVDRDRAVRDLIDLLKNGPHSSSVLVAFSLLGRTGHEDALAYMLDRLPVTPQFAMIGLQAMFDPYAHPERLPRSNWARLVEIAGPKVRVLLKDPKIPEQQRSELRHLLKDYLDEVPALDWVKIEKVVLDADSPNYRGVVENPTHAAYKALQRASDPKVVPLLVRVLKQVPLARESQAYAFHETLRHYASLCPNAMRAELIKQGLDKWADPNSAYDVKVRLYALVGLVETEDQAAEAKRIATEGRTFPRDAKFFDQLVNDLHSADLKKRRAAGEAVGRLLYSQFGYDAADLVPRRNRAAATLQGILLQAALLPEAEVRGLALRELGVKLDGKPGRAWLPALTTAAGSEHPGVSGNALRLLELITDSTGLLEVGHRPPAERVRAATAFLADRGYKP